MQKASIIDINQNLDKESFQTLFKYFLNFLRSTLSLINYLHLLINLLNQKLILITFFKYLKYLIPFIPPTNKFHKKFYFSILPISPKTYQRTQSNPAL
ncbi:hypothetical protein CKF59_05245 [Psittacicella gerlachiana]|uniref:Transmembrane protein n=1 Tax=Psittacicella gerlachiana TaxID=2028574 RepID=A0A3A1YEZ6_9GAMM|nr:hypothetical protein CKF59_05245 [Psittacicella gerlachiana]